MTKISYEKEPNLNKPYEYSEHEMKRCFNIYFLFLIHKKKLLSQDKKMLLMIH